MHLLLAPCSLEGCALRCETSHGGVVVRFRGLTACIYIPRSDITIFVTICVYI